MTSIPAAICRIFCNNFKRYSLKNGRLFLDFLLHFWNVHEIYNILRKRMSVLAYLYPKLYFGKRMLLKRLEGLASEHDSVINVLTGSKHRWK